ncbi:hypothetical protein F5Y06DRAFT_257278 [Hypoxylon sp. FL0890]|nr:hypothetical protein F5Y06DRAFT_257278 [Hypoxylon sp. FL0890]
MSMELPPGVDLTKIPLLPNPDGSPPNFDNPPSLRVTTYAVTIILMTATFILVSLRFRMNIKIYHKFALDDYLCILAWILATVYNIIVLTATPTARHIWDVPLSAIDASWVKRSAVLGTIYGPAMWFAKTAILTMYLRLFSVVKWMRWCCYFGIGFLFCAYWSLVPVSVIYNFPHGDEHWDLAMELDSRPAQVPFVVIGLLSVISDLFILVLPFPILLKLQASWKRRLGLCLIFITAIIGIVSSCFVFYLRVVLWQNKTLDSTWNVAASYLTVAVEMDVAVIISCIPAAAASWKLIAQDSKLLSSLRSVFRSSKNLVQITSGTNSVDDKGPVLRSATNPASSDSIELRP